MGMVATLLTIAGQREVVKYICTDHPTARVDTNMKDVEYGGVLSTWCTYQCNDCGKFLQPLATWEPE